MSTNNIFEGYEMRYVAFLDILGFKHKVKESLENMALLQDIREALEFLYQNKVDNEVEGLGLAKHGRLISVFSDSIYISYRETEVCAGIGILQDILYIVENLLYRGFLVRGGLTYGKMIHTESICFGPAVNDAYGLESDVAIYPRVVVDENVKGQVLSHPLYLLRDDAADSSVSDEEKLFDEMVVMDNDGILSLNYLGYGKAFDDSNEYYLQLCRVKEIIERWLSKSKGDLKLYMKYHYLKEYFNDVIIGIGNCEELIIV